MHWQLGIVILPGGHASMVVGLRWVYKVHLQNLPNLKTLYLLTLGTPASMLKPLSWQHAQSEGAYMIQHWTRPSLHHVVAVPHTCQSKTELESSLLQLKTRVSSWTTCLETYSLDKTGPGLEYSPESTRPCTLFHGRQERSVSLELFQVETVSCRRHKERKRGSQILL